MVVAVCRASGCETRAVVQFLEWGANSSWVGDFLEVRVHRDTYSNEVQRATLAGRIPVVMMYRQNHHHYYLHYLTTHIYLPTSHAVSEHRPTSTPNNHFTRQLQRQASFSFDTLPISFWKKCTIWVKVGATQEWCRQCRALPFTPSRPRSVASKSGHTILNHSSFPAPNPVWKTTSTIIRLRYTSSAPLAPWAFQAYIVAACSLLFHDC